MYRMYRLVPVFDHSETVVVEGIGGSAAPPVGNPGERPIV